MCMYTNNIVYIYIVHCTCSSAILLFPGHSVTFFSGFVYILYSRKYWWELNLAVGSQMAIAKVLVDFNLAVRYRITIHIQCICE